MNPFANLPTTDIFTEIAAHGNGSDLIQLSRVSKTFRSFLLGPIGKHVWISVRRRDGFPELQIPMTGYAILVYGRKCYRCQQERHTILWQGVALIETNFLLRIRMCFDCSSDQIISSRSTSVQGVNGEINVAAFDCVVYYPKWGPENLHVLDDLQRVSDNLEVLYNFMKNGVDEEKEKLVSKYIEERKEFTRKFHADGRLLATIPGIIKKADDVRYEEELLKQEIKAARIHLSLPLLFKILTNDMI